MIEAVNGGLPIDYFENKKDDKGDRKKNSP
jgi:hypothetical protein